MSQLTIGIPVFNEIRHLDSTLINIFEVTAGYEDVIDVAIIDNFSTDGTREYLDKIRQEYPRDNLSITFNDRNEGFNFSCDYLMRKAESEYLWIIGGQDQIYQDGLRLVLEQLKQSPALLICNATIRDETLDSIVNDSLWGDVDSSGFDNLEDFFKKLGGPCQAISCNVFRVTEVKTVLEKPLLTHLWGFLERICDLLLLDDRDLKIVYNQTPCVEMLIESDGWQTTGVDHFGKVPTREFGSFFTMLGLAEIANSKFGFNPKIRKSFSIYRDPLAIPRTLVLSRVNGLQLNLGIIQRVIRVYKRSTTFWLIGLPLLILPTNTLKLVEKSRFIVHKLRKIFRIKTF